jgi:uncharacterized protein YcaQ
MSSICFVLEMKSFLSKSIKRLVLSQHHLTEESFGRNRENIIGIISDVGGLHAQSLETPYISLWNRIMDFQWKWLDELLNQHKLIAAHLMRVTLHIVPTEEFPMYFRATRNAMRRFLMSRGLPWPPRFSATHQVILDFIREKGTVTTSEIRRFLELRGLSSKNLHRVIHYELAGIGAILRSGRSPSILTQWNWSTAESLIDISSLETVTEEEAKEWLVQKYLKAFGPSTIEDIVSYTWHGKAETRKIIERLVARGRVSEFRVSGAGKHWISSEDVGRIERFEAVSHSSQKISIVSVLPEFDPLTTGYRKRWKKLISVPPIRPGLRSHPVPGVILVDGEILGKYLPWPNFAIFLDLRNRNLGDIIHKFEELATRKNLKSFCVKQINGKDVISRELKPMLRRFYKLGYSIQEGYLCRQLSAQDN